MTLGTKVSDKEGINANLGGIFKDSRTRVRSEGFVAVTKYEKERAPRIMRKKTEMAYSCPENTQVKPVKKSTSGTIPHNKFIILRPSPSSKYSNIIKTVIAANAIGLATINKRNCIVRIISPGRGCLLVDCGLKTNPWYNLLKTVEIRNPSSVMTIDVDSIHLRQ